MLKFDEPSHTYSVNGKKLKSVTQIVESLFPFNEDLIAGIVSRKTGFEIDYIKSHWALIRTIASSKGTFYHQLAEDYFHGKSIPEGLYESQIKQFFKDYSFLKKYKAEWQVFSEELGVAGTVDLILEGEDGLYLFDWKTSKEIKMGSDWSGKGVGEKLMNCSYVQYSLQMSIYRYIIEKYYGKKVVYSGIIHLKKEGNYNLIQAMYLKKETKRCVEQPHC